MLSTIKHEAHSSRRYSRIAVVLKMFRWLICGLVLAAARVKGDKEVMSHVTAHFGKSLQECREEAGLGKDIMEEFQQFWAEDFEVVHRELGCALICMSRKFVLMKDDARLHHTNLDDYIRSFPNGEILAAKMVDLLHNCEQEHYDIDDECLRVVKSAACFKEKAKKEGIAPEVAMIEAVMEQY